MSASVNPWKIELFGPLRATRGERAISRFRTQKTGALLACLALNGPRPYRREEMITLLWPEYDSEPGRNCLRIALNSLRQQMEVDDLPPGSVLIADRSQVQLAPDAFQTDKAEFETALQEAERAADARGKIASFTQAANLYMGELLPGMDEECIVIERRRLEEVHFNALRKLVKLQFQQKEYEAALEYARKALNCDPMREESYRTVMQLYAALGRPGAALRQYQELERVLQEEMQAIPSAKTRELAAQLAGSARTPRPTNASVGVLERESTPTVPPTNSAFPLSFPPLRSVPSTPHRTTRLPAPLTRFFGREDSLTQILDWIDNPENRLLTLTGLGGSGKTRLAISAAEHVFDEFSGSVWFVPLAGVMEARQLPDAILRALNAPRVPNMSPLDRIVQSLSTQTSLLVLDNFEQLTESAALIVQTLLDRVTTLKILVTSRQRLNLTGEMEHPVLPLATPGTPGTPERLLEFASVQLFVDRAQAVRPGFQVTQQNAASLAALCHYLEGVPLAIELAAAYAQAMSPAQILARLSPRFPLLVNRNRDAQPRHASLWAALDWSYQLLSPELQRFFAQLSVFQGGWTLDAVEAVSQEPFALEYLMQLRERSLIQVEDTDAEMRFSLLETVREFASECLVEQDRAAVRSAHAAFFHSFVESAEEHLRGPEASFWLDQMIREQENLWASMDWIIQTAEASTEESLCTMALQMAGSLWLYCSLRDEHEEGYRSLERVLALPAPTPPSLRLKAMRGAGNLAYQMGRYTEARSLFERVLTLAREMKAGDHEAAALGSLGNIANDQGDSALARLFLNRSLTAFRERGDKRGIMLTLGNLGNVAYDQADYPLALALYTEAMQMFRYTGDSLNICQGLNHLAQTHLQMGDVETVSSLLAEALPLCRRLDSRRTLVALLQTCVRLALQQQEPVHAARLVGVIETLCTTSHISLSEKAHAEIRAVAFQVQTLLGEPSFSQYQTQGSRTSLDQALDNVLLPTASLPPR